MIIISIVIIMGSYAKDLMATGVNKINCLNVLSLSFFKLFSCLIEISIYLHNISSIIVVFPLSPAFVSCMWCVERNLFDWDSFCLTKPSRICWTTSSSRSVCLSKDFHHYFWFLLLSWYSCNIVSFSVVRISCFCLVNNTDPDGKMDCIIMSHILACNT